MRTQKVHFENPRGHRLTGRLVLPPNRHPHHYALFAHCFTCSKNLGAARQISQALAGMGFGVLRFDFTGLGESEGDFSDTNFSGNVEDLEAAAAFLKRDYEAPALLVGHSLGGAAVLFAATRLPTVRAVATVGAPSDPDHVTRLLQSSLEEIREEGMARVNIGGRGFTIQRQFLEDLRNHSLDRAIKGLEASLLILHSPQDRVVSVDNAEKIYRAARHPKSFLSLDGADHLLSRAEDASYAGQVIGSWASRYLERQREEPLKSDHQVVASLDAEDGFTTRMKVGNHYLTADEPVSYSGNDFGPSPYELLSASLSACTAMTLQMYARRKGWPLENVEVHTSYAREHARDGLECMEDPNAKIDTFHRVVEFSGALDKDQRSRLLEIAGRCPVHRTLESPIQVLTREAEDRPKSAG